MLAVLAKLTALTQAQRRAFQEGDRTEFVRLDHELEQTVGEKERVIGALRQHEADHHCQDYHAQPTPPRK